MNAPTSTMTTVAYSVTARKTAEKPSDYLTFAEAHAQYSGSPKPTTMAVWLCTKRYPDFTAIVSYQGGNRRIRRDKWEALLERGFGSRKKKSEQEAA